MMGIQFSIECQTQSLPGLIDPIQVLSNNPPSQTCSSVKAIETMYGSVSFAHSEPTSIPSLTSLAFASPASLTVLSQGTRQHSCGIQMCECGSWSWIGKIICWYVHSLHRCDGTRFGGGNSLLKSTQICCECWLISYRRWDTTKQS